MSKAPKGIEGFKSSTGSFLTQALFYEKNTFDNRKGVLYTLKTRDHKGFPSLKRLYFELDDPTEYKVANDLFDGWEHWLVLCELAWFKPFVQEWRTEMAVKRASESLDCMIGEVRSGGKGAAPAARYLLSSDWLAETSKGKAKKVGRPSKEDIKNKLQEQVNEMSNVDKDAERVLN